MRLPLLEEAAKAAGTRIRRISEDGVVEARGLRSKKVVILVRLVPNTT